MEQGSMSGPANPSALLEAREESPLAVSSRAAAGPEPAPELTIIVPTLNGGDNVGPLTDRLNDLLEGVA
jgi:hypothetical protein